VNCEFSELSVVADKMLGYSHTIFHTSGTDTKEQAGRSHNAGLPTVYQKIGGAWKIVHEHIFISRRS